MQNFEHWACDMPVDEEKYLTLEGQDEMVLLAERTQKRFSSIIQKKYDNRIFQVNEHNNYLYFQFVIFQLLQKLSKININ